MSAEEADKKQPLLRRGVGDHPSPDQWLYFCGVCLAAAYSNAEFGQKS